MQTLFEKDGKSQTLNIAMGNGARLTLTVVIAKKMYSRPAYMYSLIRHSYKWKGQYTCPCKRLIMLWISRANVFLCIFHSLEPCKWAKIWWYKYTLSWFWDYELHNSMIKRLFRLCSLNAFSWGFWYYCWFKCYHRIFYIFLYEILLGIHCRMRLNLHL